MKSYKKFRFGFILLLTFLFFSLSVTSAYADQLSLLSTKVRLYNGDSYVSKTYVNYPDELKNNDAKVNLPDSGTEQREYEYVVPDSNFNTNLSFGTINTPGSPMSGNFWYYGENTKLDMLDESNAANTRTTIFGKILPDDDFTFPRPFTFKVWYGNVSAKVELNAKVMARLCLQSLESDAIDVTLTVVAAKPTESYTTNLKDNVSSFTITAKTLDDNNYTIVAEIDEGQVEVNGMEITVTPEWKEDAASDTSRTLKITTGYKGLTPYTAGNFGDNVYVPTTYTITLNRVAVTDVPSITEPQPQDVELWEDDAPGTLDISATIAPGNDIMYQWYKSSTDNAEDFVPIKNANGASYDLQALFDELKSNETLKNQSSTTVYYRCRVSNAKDNGEYDADGKNYQDSRIIKVIVKASPMPTGLEIKLVKKNPDGNYVNRAGDKYSIVEDTEISFAQGSEEIEDYAIMLLADIYRDDETAKNNYIEKQFVLNRHNEDPSQPGYNGEGTQAQNAGLSDVSKDIEYRLYSVSTDMTGTLYYTGTVRYFAIGQSASRFMDSKNDKAIKIEIIAKGAQKPEITAQPKVSTRYRIGEIAIAPVGVAASVKDGGTLSYQWYERAEDEANGTAISGAMNSYYTPPSHNDECTFYYYCEVTNTVVGGFTATTKSNEAKIVFADSLWEGEGTESSPYLINSLEDLAALRDNVNLENQSYAGKFFQMTADIELPVDWEPIGVYFRDGREDYLWPFSGTFDGGNHKITVATGGKPLFGILRRATIKNLNIYGKEIDGTALVNEFVIDYEANGWTATFENVTLKEGSSTRLSGFIDGVASGTNTINFTNCRVEKGVVIGYTEEESGLGSFCSNLSGTISNCVSEATIKGVNSIGGLTGGKNQSMSTCKIVNSAFLGEIIATGNNVGGIIGSGYASDDAPNSPSVSVQDCYVDAVITGVNNVGGILGREYVAQNWSNGIGYIQNNHFYGTINGSGKNVGGIIGYMAGLNKYNVIENNYFREGCGAEKGMGFISYIDTNAVTPSATIAVDKTFYYNTEYSGSESQSETFKFLENVNKLISSVANYMTPAPIYKVNVFRTDDPLGADADKLTRMMSEADFKGGTVTNLLNAGRTDGVWVQGTKYPTLSGAVLPVELTLSGDYKTEYYIGEEFDPTGMAFTVTMSDGTSKILSASEVRFEGFDNIKQAVLHMAAYYGTLKAEFDVKILIKPADNPSNPSANPNTIRVYFKLMGDTAHGAPAGDKDTHTLQKGGLTQWIANKSYEVDINSTVWDLIKKVLEENNMTWRNPSGNYIEAITANGQTLAEFTNGNYSGWMYTLNATHPDLGVSEQFLQNGDRIVLHYTDDYTLEEGSEAMSGMSGGGAGGGKGTGDNADSVVLQPGTFLNGAGQNEASVTTNEVNKAVTSAKEDNLKTIVIEPNVKGSEPSVLLKIALDGAKAIADANMGLTVNTNKGSLAIGEAALKSIYSQAVGIDIRVIVEAKNTKADTVKNDATNALQQAAASLRGTVESLFSNASVTEVTILSDNKAITSFGGHELTINLPVARDKYIEGQSYKVVVVSADGKVETIIGKCMKYNGQIVVQVQVNHLSTFIVTNETEKAAAAQTKMNFADVNEGQWFYEAVKFVFEAGLMNGTDGNKFEPNGNLNRAMLVTILYRLENQPEITANNKFTDVKSGQWYTEAVVWASANGIVNGYEDNTFKPTSNVSREEMAAMLMRYAEYKGVDVSATKDLSGYGDAAKVAAWAKQNMAWANSAGLIQGDENNNLNPQGKATRAEAATILMRLVKNVVK